MTELGHKSRTRFSTERPATAASALAVVLCLALSGCAENRFATRSPAWADTLQGTTERDEITADPSQEAEPEYGVSGVAGRPRTDFYRPGSGVLVGGAKSIAAAREQPDGDIKLNFQNANLLEVVKVVLGDMLKLNYVIDPEVQGAVSMQTARALRREDLIPTLELMLRMNNAALVTTDNVYRVVPLPKALTEVRASQLGDSSLALPRGFSVRVVPLRYVSAEEMAQILGPLVAGGNQLLRVDSARNLLVLASAGSDLDRLLETIEVFDVDQMAGMSVGLFTPDFVDAATLAKDLEELLANPKYGLMRGLVRFIVVERLNGLMVVTPRAEHLASVREWIRRLDRDTGDANPRLFIYRVQNGKAVELADVLRKVFGASEEGLPDPASLAPGLEPATVGQSSDPESNQQSESGSPIRAPQPAGAGAEGLAVIRNEQVQVIADEPNNALLILARGHEYRQILAALRQLDVSPLQVLIEVTIAEVTLADNLSFGVEWFFKNNFGSKVGEGLLDLGADGIGALVPGFSYALKGPDVRFVLNTLAEESNLSIISSPSLLVLNNHEASINVGEEVPVATQESQSTTDSDSPLINTIEYRDTGVLLKVKPRVNAGGLVIMDVEQEQSQAPSTSGDDLLTPRIRQRKISSTVAVNSGDTIILGGLIQENRDLSESGLPGLHKIPVVGALFGTKSDNQERTELIVMITPRAITNSTAALQVTEEYRRRLKKLIPSRAADDRRVKPADSKAMTGDDSTSQSVTPEANAENSSNPKSVVEHPGDKAPAEPAGGTAELPVNSTAAGVKQEGWVIQIGSFKEKQRAERLVRRLREAGVDAAAQTKVSLDGATWYRVFAGPEENKKQAAALLPRVSEAVGVKGFLTEY